MAMRIGEATELEAIDLAAWDQCARAGRWNAKAAVNRVRKFAERARWTALDLVQHGGFDSDVARSIADDVARRASAWID
jgi:hypothetical protein